ncbi:alpha/beta hydrolase [Kribbella albertanoniae]|uniref:Alpha/beta hydrolase n=1 Tax=Kribbella albertanoniae TaxID=1266829 RepID=A0A4R4PPN7_9ACTN|nr:alpha/beta hydrolase [Kribbella albertanoniae]TDC24210.1 alpha/beta hydrolase [Kribbella albertanoniae]
MKLLEYTLYGPTDGFPVMSLGGSPSTRWKRPDVVESIEATGLRMVIPDRPGYGGSPRQPGRSVADAATDVANLADHLGWSTFAVTGGSGGGPHALACAALLPDRITCCAVVGGIAPLTTDGPEPTEDDEASDPRQSLTAWLAVHDPARFRARFAEGAEQIMAAVAAGGPEFPPAPGSPPGPPARDDDAAMARLTATFGSGSVDGCLDDNIAFGTPWGFNLTDVRVPTTIWHGTSDERARTHAVLLTEAMPAAESIQYAGGHVPPAAAYREILEWLRGATNATGAGR